ncbi:MAG: right-handed parallel beta-helix repeat-containing protein [Lachnospiraceae bacterium]|nr:right-handed parallel beta-helix repeat-containing protein [Lachnospiraceae bacterium]
MKNKMLAVLLAFAMIGSGLPGNVVLAAEGTEEILKEQDVEDLEAAEVKEIDFEDETEWESEEPAAEENEIGLKSAGSEKENQKDQLVIYQETENRRAANTTDLPGTLQNGVYRDTFDSSNSKADIQKALNCIVDGTAEKVEITLKGTISINGGLVVYSNTTIDARGAVIKETSSNGSLIASATARNYAGTFYKKGYKNTENITIKGGKWDGNKRAGQVVRFVHSTNVVLDGLTIVNCTNKGHLLSLEGVDTAVVKNCVLKGHRDMKDVKEAIHLDIVHNQVTTPDLERKEYDDLPNRNITITKNKITDAPNAIGSHGAVKGVYHQNIVISNNTISNIRAIPIKIYNYKNVTLTKNKISNSNGGIKVYTHTQSSGDREDRDGAYFEPNKGVVTEALPAKSDYKILVKENVFANIKGGPAVQTQGSKDRPMSKIRIEGNVINKTGDKGIWLLTYCPNTVVKNNTISNTASSGIDARSRCNGSVLEGNTINYAGESGIAVMADISKVKVVNNKVNKSKGHGIWVYRKANSITVSGNTVNHATQNGIYVSAKSNKAKVQNNTIKGTIKQNGIYVHQSPSAVVGSNKIGNVGKNGIYVDSGSNSAKVSENTVGACKGSGIMVYKSDGVTLNKNSIASSKGNGIQVSAAQKASTISNNVIKKAGKHGIHIYKAKKTKISGNKVSNTKERGISLDAGSNNSSVSKNQIKNTKAQGIYAYNAASLNVNGNTLTKIGKDGIRIGQAGKSLKITKNKLTNVKGKGINVWAISNTKIAENTLQDIREEALLLQNTNANVGTTWMTQVNQVSKKKKVVSGTARDGSKYTVTVDGKDYSAKVKNGAFKTSKIKTIKSGTKVTVTEIIAGKNRLVTVLQAK